MDLFIVTGASKGLGEAFVRRLSQPGRRIVAIARTQNDRLIRETKGRGAAIDWICYDLAQTDGLDALMAGVLKNGQAQTERESTLCLINNAAVLEPMAPAERCEHDAVVLHFHVNLLAPILLTESFIRHTAGLPANKYVLNVSSGAGKKPYHGWSSYCAAKAGLDMFTRCVGFEQGEAEGGVRVVSVAPGVVDTDMQAAIRGTSEDRFRQKARFVELKRSGALLSPDAAAERVLRLLFDRRFANGSVLDIRDFAE
jgi:benzil reductase ((S)-benzoin forming)